MGCGHEVIDQEAILVNGVCLPDGSIPTSTSSTFTTLPLHRHNVITALLTFRCTKSELFNSPNSILPNVIVALTVTDWTKHLAVET